MPILSSHAELRDLLARSRTLAVAGLSGDPARDSYNVAEYMKSRGYRIIGVNPKYQELFGERAYPSLEALPEEERRAVDIVVVFRKPDAALEMAREVARLKFPAIWYQLGLATPEAVDEADRAGLTVVSENCIKVAHMLLKP